MNSQELIRLFKINFNKLLEEVSNINKQQFEILILDEKYDQYHNKIGKDYRYSDFRYKDRIISVGIWDNNKNRLLGVTNFIFLEKADFNNYFFWKQSKEDENSLKKISLANLMNGKYDNAIIIGYTKTEETLNKVFGIRVMLDIYNKVVIPLKVPILIECTGVFNLPEKMKQQSIIDKNLINNPLNIGDTYQEGKAVEKFCIFTKMQFENVYNIRTFGKVFIKFE